MTDTAPDTRPPGVAQPRLETWRNASPGRVFITKFDAGGMERSTPVAGGRTITLTPQERRMNQDRCANEELDFFKNGTMEPIRLVDDEWDFEELVNNRQILTEAQIDELLKGHPQTFKKRVDELTNAVAVQRIIERGIELDILTPSKQKLLDQRLGALNPDRLAQSKIGTEGGTTGLADGAPDPGMKEPERADWENFVPTHEV